VGNSTGEGVCTFMVVWCSECGIFWKVWRLSGTFLFCYSRTAFFKLWSADHKWSSGSALVVLGLTFYEINYPAYIDVLL
jgi:hypothetical protein